MIELSRRAVGKGVALDKRNGQSLFLVCKKGRGLQVYIAFIFFFVCCSPTLAWREGCLLSSITFHFFCGSFFRSYLFLESWYV